MSDMSIPSLEEMKSLSVEQLPAVADSIREFLIESVSQTGGHIGANLGVVELTLALHYVFDSPRDKLVFDTGHQGYTHKILTGRQDLFASLNQWKGMNRFLTRAESEHDVIDATHAGTAISIASGMAYEFKKTRSGNHVVAVVGDGSMAEGMSFEGLNWSACMEIPLIIVLNDNEMAIAQSVGGIRNLTTGDDWQEKAKAFFQGLGFEYRAVPDGHDIAALVPTLSEAKGLCRPVIVHTKTEKGRGLPCAKDHPYKMHFSMAFDPKTGAGASPTVAGRTYATVAAEQLLDALAEDEDIYVITPATPYASALDECLAKYPERVLDVGMAEQHALGMASGLALAGKKPVVCYQTTFMQRAFDQLLHDACYMELPVTVLGVRSGFAGYDGPTHHGLYDISYLRSLPNLKVRYPVSTRDFREMLSERLKNPVGPMVLLHAYEPVPDPEPAIELPSDGLALASDGGDGVILCLGNRLVQAMELSELLNVKCGRNFGIGCVSHIKPFPVRRMLEVCGPVEYVITLEESTLPGGFGGAVCEALADAQETKRVFRSAVPDRFVPGGSKQECTNECGMSPGQVVEQVLKLWPELGQKT